jgi:putative PIN family toxin of toxin-antitoxin system
VRVLLDSNVWLGILTTDGFCRRVWRAARRTCKFSASRDILEEIEEKLRTKFGFSPRHARLMTFFVERQTEAVPVVSMINICRDADDNRILAASLDSGCSHLVTGDSDLLILQKFEHVSIVTPREFLQLIPADGSM